MGSLSFPFSKAQAFATSTQVPESGGGEQFWGSWGMRGKEGLTKFHNAWGSRGYLKATDASACLPMWPMAGISVGVCVICASDLCFLSCLASASVLLHPPFCDHLACLSPVSVPLSVPLQNGFAIIRPPGHHAEESTAM